MKNDRSGEDLEKDSVKKNQTIWARGKERRKLLLLLLGNGLKKMEVQGLLCKRHEVGKAARAQCSG